MKKLTILLTFLIAFTVNIKLNAQDTTKYVTDTNTEKLIDKYTDKVHAAIISLAEALEVPVEHVYNVLTKQQVVEAWLGLGILIISLIFIFYAGWASTKVSNWGDHISKKDYSGMVGKSIISLVIAMFILITFFGAGYYSDIFTGFMNPEYGAMMEIKDFIK